ncbi:hypothetical protein [Gordonia malaquae]
MTKVFDVCEPAWSAPAALLVPVLRPAEERERKLPRERAALSKHASA